MGQFCRRSTQQAVFEQSSLGLDFLIPVGRVGRVAQPLLSTSPGEMPRPFVTLQKSVQTALLSVSRTVTSDKAVRLTIRIMKSHDNDPFL